VEHWKTRFEVARQYIQVTVEQEDKTDRNQRKRARQKQKKKKPLSAAAKPPGATDSQPGGPRLAVIDGGEDGGDTVGEPEAMEE